MAFRLNSCALCVALLLVLLCAFQNFGFDDDEDYLDDDDGGADGKTADHGLNSHLCLDVIERPSPAGTGRAFRSTSHPPWTVAISLGAALWQRGLFSSLDSASVCVLLGPRTAWFLGITRCFACPDAPLRRGSHFLRDQGALGEAIYGSDTPVLSVGLCTVGIEGGACFPACSSLDPLSVCPNLLWNQLLCVDILTV